ncbi:MAG: DUF1015 domain-containing protein [Pedobacter sp.]|nr:MAG: DUF1015 domain-containing protein [Pedobacter sp.]
MPRIKPFFALRPHPLRQNQVVSWPLDNYSEGQARLILSENPYSFLHLVDPALDHPYLRGPRQDLLYKKIAENLDAFIDDQTLIFEKKAAIYIYQIHTDLGIFSGLWTLTSIDSYLNGNIKKHELTVARRESLLADYLLHSYLDANPVLITYQENDVIQAILENYISTAEPINDYVSEEGHRHIFWAIVNPEHQALIIDEFAKMTTYIADGHHRAAAMAKMALQRRELFKSDLEANFNYFNTAYFSHKELKILPFHRLVKGLGLLSKEEFILSINELFELEKVNSYFIPDKPKCFGMYFEKQWYSLQIKSDFYNRLLEFANPVEILDVSILHKYLLEHKLNIMDPRTDARLRYEGGNVEVSALESQVDNGNFTLLFTLNPVSVEEIMKVADANLTMPPKSTWIAPKFRLGLLSHYLFSSQG